MADSVLTGFHAVEERVRSLHGIKAADCTLFFAKPGPRVKKIIALAQKSGIRCLERDARFLDELCASLPKEARDHRGMVLQIPAQTSVASGNSVNFNQWIESARSKSARQLVLLLDSVTDPHNVGAILRSADQFAASLLVLPERRGANDIARNEVIARSSAGASAWVPVAVVQNLSRAAQLLKDAGFWIYGADSEGQSVQNLRFANKSAIVMGSEGSGISRLLREQCDALVSIPTSGKIDSLNVSVAAGILLYEFNRQALQ